MNNQSKQRGAITSIDIGERDSVVAAIGIGLPVPNVRVACSVIQGCS